MSDSNKGYSKQWVSGPLRVTKQIGAEDGMLGSFTLCLYWNPTDDDDRVLWVDFELFEVTCLFGPAGTPYYPRRDATIGLDTVLSLAEAETAAEGFVKSDGCTQFTVGEVHVDSRAGLLQLLNAIETAREECAMAMPGSDVILEYDNETKGRE